MIKILLSLFLFVAVSLNSLEAKQCHLSLRNDVYLSSNNINSSCEEGPRLRPRIVEWSRLSNRGINKCQPEFNYQDVAVYTVATNETDGFKRYVRSAKVTGIYENVKILGMGKPWTGGDVKRYAGGGQKVNLLRDALKQFKDDSEKIVLFTDSYDVIFSDGLPEIVDKFHDFDARVLFSAEEYLWPDKSLNVKYPKVARGKNYLNSGGFIGYANDLYAILTSSDIQDTDDDQLFYTKIYLDPELREKHKIKLDHKSQLFQNLNGAVNDVQLIFKGNDAFLQNTEFNTNPLIIHGNGVSKSVLNAITNYIPKVWTPEEGCLGCWEETIELLESAEPEQFPITLIAIFIHKPSAFLDEFLLKINRQKYPKSRLHLFVYNNVPYHEETVKEFLAKHGEKYLSVKQILPSDGIDEASARTLAMTYALTKECSGYFSIESVAHLDNEHTLRLLTEQQRGIVAPLLVRPKKAWSNFWGAVNADGFYARSSDYMQIVHNERRGLWNVPLVRDCYLINATLIGNDATRPSYSEGDMDPDMAFAYSNRARDIFMYVTNRLDFGHLVNNDNYDTTLTNPDIYQIFDNKLDWEKRYIHENYSLSFKDNATHYQPCPDVYWFPIVSTRFTKELIEVVEAYGKWSDGTNKDERLSGGYENVPTRDIHMNQVKMEQNWLYFLKEYVKPLQERIFLGYFHDDSRIDGGYEAVPTRDIHANQVDFEEEWLEFLRQYVSPLQQIVFTGYLDYPPRSLMNFVVRYRPDEQPSLRPHHDSSTYTINIALNQAGKDYEGGGCKFIRYNCAVTDTKPGWMLMHPGRLTHYHEGLRVTKGTRYIMISFVDP